jgi:hypothetical protein
MADPNLRILDIQTVADSNLRMLGIRTGADSNRRKRGSSPPQLIHGCYLKQQLINE